ncbi:hypothetical protein BUZ11_07305 [Staphylococcus gallinarum]|nr:hypothetical protein BUZ15_11655 [Staphylococcus gallinarum]RIL32155.1 hypothetical protein BUY98_10190 [Staphylococcus gallinarum]RIO82558.1 hypothetical protein BUZ11_07305 [Staphylococcus gallinarum]
MNSICLVCVAISIIKCIILHLRIFYYVLLTRFPRGQLQPVVFSLSCSHRSLTKIRHCQI